MKNWNELWDQKTITLNHYPLSKRFCPATFLDGRLIRSCGWKHGLLFNYQTYEKLLALVSSQGFCLETIDKG